MTLFAALLLASAMPQAPYAYTQLDDPALEAEAHQLMTELRCLVCQGQSIADSDADMAGDMRHLVRTRIAAGERPEEIRAYLIERYGDWVSYKPSSGNPLLYPLFLAPLFLLALGLWMVRRRFRIGKGA